MATWTAAVTDVKRDAALPTALVTISFTDDSTPPNVRTPDPFRVSDSTTIPSIAADYITQLGLADTTVKIPIGPITLPKVTASDTLKATFRANVVQLYQLQRLVALGVLQSNDARLVAVQSAVGSALNTTPALLASVPIV